MAEVMSPALWRVSNGHSSLRSSAPNAYLECPFYVFSANPHTVYTYIQVYTRYLVLTITITINNSRMYKRIGQITIWG